jgi:hypothetical protein
VCVCVCVCVCMALARECFEVPKECPPKVHMYEFEQQFESKLRGNLVPALGYRKFLQDEFVQEPLTMGLLQNNLEISCSPR